MAFLDKDLSLLRRLANRLGYHPTQHAVVQCRRSGFKYSQQVACSDIVSKWLVCIRSTAFRAQLASPETSSVTRLANGSRHFMPWHLQLICWVQVSALLPVYSHTNLNLLGLLAYRIWKIERTVANTRTTRMTTTSILRVIMDAAIVYSIALLCTLIGSVCSNNGSLVMIDVVIIPITFIIEKY